MNLYISHIVFKVRGVTGLRYACQGRSSRQPEKILRRRMHPNMYSSLFLCFYSVQSFQFRFHSSCSCDCERSLLSSIRLFESGPSQLENLWGPDLQIVMVTAILLVVVSPKRITIHIDTSHGPDTLNWYVYP